MAELNPPPGKNTAGALRATLAIMVVAAVLSWLVVPMRELLAALAIGAAVAAPFLRLALVAATWRTRRDLPYLILAGVLIVAVATLAALR